MLLATVGILLIVGLLGFAAYFVGREHLDALKHDQEILGEPLRTMHLR